MRLSRRITCRAIGIVSLLSTLAAGGLQAGERNGQKDFDFWMGSWKVHNRRLRNPLSGSTSWYEFDGTMVARPIWGGRANMDEYEADSPTGHIQGMTLRLYDPKARQWSIYWANSATGTLEKPMVGRFENGRGEFFDQETFEGKSIFVRYVWSNITAISCRWEQAFSTDGGKTWETNWIMTFTRDDPRTSERDERDPMKPCCPVLELRQYTLHPGAREALIGLFEEHFVEGQERHGIRVVGQFRDLGNGDRFVWLRGFADMDARKRALEGFYSGSVWMKYRGSANATMIDSDNVLLLKPSGPDGGFRLDAVQRAPIDDAERPGGIVVATIYSFHGPVDPTFGSWFRSEVTPVLARAGISVLAQFVTEPAPNSFPRLPVREGENVFVWFAAFPDQQSLSTAERRLEESPEWRAQILPKLRTLTKGNPERLFLAPTRRSLLR
jgi:hypothetical protein